MSGKLVLAACGLAWAMLPARAEAQWRWDGGGYHPATAEESILRGWADWIRAQGELRVLSAQAALTRQQALRQALENWVEGTRSYFERKRLNREYREETRRPRLTAAQLEDLAKRKAPERLGPGRFDPASNLVVWPAILNDETYAPYREQLEAALAEQAAGGSAQAVIEAARRLEAELQRRIRRYAPFEYVKAKKFLRSLRYETQLLAAG